jgi:hypothetical protein
MSGWRQDAPVKLFSVRGHALDVQEPATFLCDPTVGGQVRRRHGAGGGRCGWRAPCVVKLYALRIAQAAMGEAPRQTAPKTRRYGVGVGGEMAVVERCEKVTSVDESRTSGGQHSRSQGTVPWLGLSAYPPSLFHHTTKAKVKQPCETALSPVKGTAPFIYASSQSQSTPINIQWGSSAHTAIPRHQTAPPTRVRRLSISRLST